MKYKVTALDNRHYPPMHIETTYQCNQSERVSTPALIAYYLNKGYDFWKRNDQGNYIVNSHGNKVFDDKHFFAYKTKYIHDINICEIQDCEAQAHSENINNKEVIKMTKTLKVAIEVDGRKIEKEVSVNVNKATGMCKGKVGEVTYLWNPKKYQLPILSLTKEQGKKTYSNCRTSAQRVSKTMQLRRMTKAFLQAYKQELLKAKGDHQEELGKTPQKPMEQIPQGYEFVPSTMFEWRG